MSTSAMEAAEKEAIASSLSTSGDEKPIIHKERSCWKVTLIVVVCCGLIWGVAVLPAIFYANKLQPPSHPSHLEPGTNGSNATILIPKYPCSEPLIFNSKSHLCEPPCPWIILSPAEDHALKVVDNLSIAVSLLGFLIILATWIRIKQLRIFPHIIPLYIQALSAAISLFLAIGNGMGREKAFCSSKFMKESLDNPTLFCTVQGVLIHYFTVALALWFVVYSLNLFQMIFSDYPVNLKSRSFKRKNIAYSLTCWLLPWIPVGIVLGSNSGYNVVFMRYCFPVGEHVSFFTTSLITEIAQAVGCTCLFAVVYKLFRLRDIEGVTGAQNELRKRQMNKVVIRLVCLMFAYAVCVVLTYVPICALQRNSKLLEHHINEYFACLVFSAPEFCPKTYERYTFSVTFVVSTLSTAFFALTTVCFLAFNKQSRKLWEFWYRRLKKCCS